MKQSLSAALLGGVLLIAGCRFGVNSGIVYSRSADPNVRNGTAYDTAILPLANYDTVVIPTRATVNTSTGERTLRIELAKTLANMGHPPERSSIDDARKKMGCAWRSSGRKLCLATFGEFDSGIEGGRRIELTVTVPEGIHVERDDGYEMDRNVRDGPSRSKLREQSDSHGVWYSPEDSDEKWTPIPDHPNPSAAAEH